MNALSLTLSSQKRSAFDLFLGGVDELTSEEILQTDGIWKTSNEKNGTHLESAQYRDSWDSKIIIALCFLFIFYRLFI